MGSFGANKVGLFFSLSSINYLTLFLIPSLLIAFPMRIVWLLRLALSSASLLEVVWVWFLTLDQRKGRVVTSEKEVLPFVKWRRELLIIDCFIVLN